MGTGSSSEHNFLLLLFGHLHELYLGTRDNYFRTRNLSAYNLILHFLFICKFETRDAILHSHFKMKMIKVLNTCPKSNSSFTRNLSSYIIQFHSINRNSEILQL